MIVPTYDEGENLPDVVERLLVAAPDVAVPVADDNSPDGTGEIADQLAAGDAQGRISVLHREGKQGLGAAYIASFRSGLDRGYTVLGRDGRRRQPPPRTCPQSFTQPIVSNLRTHAFLQASFFFEARPFLTVRLGSRCSLGCSRPEASRPDCGSQAHTR